MKEPRVLAAISLSAGLVVAVGGYALLRATQSLTQANAEPAMMGWSAHIGYFWRAATLAYAGGMAAFCVFLGGRARPRVAARALAWAVPVAAALLALQAAFFP